MKKFVTLLVFILMFIGLNQSNAQSKFVRKWTQFGVKLESTTLTTPWIFGLGWSAAHDDGGKWFKNLFLAGKTWNMAPYPARTSCEKIIDTARGWSAEVVFAYNRYGVGNYFSDAAPRPEGLVTAISDIYSVDFHAKYDFNKAYDLNSLWGGKEIFQPFCLFGHGWTYRAVGPHRSTITMNAGLGFNVFIYKGFGIQIQSVAKFGMKDRFPTSGSNYLQHSVGFIYKMNPLHIKRRNIGGLKCTPWIIGLGWSIAHDDGGKWFKNLFAANKTWNMAAYPARISAEKILDTARGWSAELVFAYNRYGVGNYFSDAAPRPEGLVASQSSIVSVDLHGKYDFNKLYNLNSLWGGNEIFQPYGVFGAGYTYRDMAPHHNTVSLNLGLGFNVFIYKGVGFQVQSVAKFGMKERFPTAGSNYLQHSIGLVYKFSTCANKKQTYKFKKHAIKKVL